MMCGMITFDHWTQTNVETVNGKCRGSLVIKETATEHSNWRTRAYSADACKSRK